MPSPRTFLALAAFGVSLASAADCDKSITIKSNGDTKIDCKTVKGSVTFDSDDISGAIDLSGIEEIEGDLVIKENKNIQSLSGSSLAKIGGKFQLEQLEALTAINFNNLEEVKEIEWISLTALETVQFGTDGVTTVSKVRISDSSLSSLDGLSMESVGSFKIDNNKQLLKWETLLTEIKDELIVADNSEDLEVSFPELTQAGDIDVRGVKGLDMPLLQKISGSFLLTDNNVMEAFIAPNLTQTGESVSLRNNGGLSNVSFPLLTRTGGGLTVHNNQNLLEIDGFPKLERVAGSVTMRGNFTDIELPSLDAVKGTLDIQSTEDIEESCTKLEEVKDSVGKFRCISENENANEGSNKDSDDDDKDDAGVLFGANAPLVLSIAVVGALLQLL